MTAPTLAEALQSQHETAMILQAETIRDWPMTRERTAQAEIHVRTALWERGLDRISDETQYRIYSMLSFAMPNDDAYASETKSLPELEKEANAETAYYEQLERQSCPECGDGHCPADDDKVIEKGTERPVF